MEARDFRSIGRAAQEGLRRRALVLIAQNGMSQAEAARVVGFHHQALRSPPAANRPLGSWRACEEGGNHCGSPLR